LPGATDDNPVHSGKTSPRTSKELVFVGLVIVFSLLLLLAAIALQITAIDFANRGLQDNSFNSTWCSPAFLSLSQGEVQDANCNWRPIHKDERQGVGCVNLPPGTRQQRWLIGTIAIVVASLIFQTIDFFVLVLVNVKYKTFSGVKLKRPWFSIFIGLALMLTVAGMSGIHSMSLPEEINETVLVRMNDTSGPTTQCVTLFAAGLRGSIIGWHDGVFKSWGTLFFGASNTD
jgi:hypothetical protein